MGAGKTTVGKRLAARLGYKFYDTDFLVRRGFGKPVSRIFEEHGEQAFRDAELMVLQELLKRQRVVVSTGGGTLGRDEMMTLALASSTVVYLHAPVEDLYERVIFSPKDRPILETPNTEEVFRALYDKRTAIYQRAHLVVDTDHRQPENVVTAILQRFDQASGDGNPADGE